MKKQHVLAAVLSVLFAAMWSLPALSQPSQDRGSPSRATHSPGVDPIPNRYLAFGDSITYGGYADLPYPSRLNGKLNIRVALSEVINAGLSGEATFGGSERITGEVSTYRPQFVLILEGTNDVTRDKLPSDVYNNLRTMIDNARETAGVENVQVMLATIIPRLDYKNDATWVMNQQAVIPAATDAGVPICDLWQAFLDFGPWTYLFMDDVHPNDAGLQLIADTFYDCMLAAFPEVAEETVPPATWIEWAPATVECGQTIPVQWAGNDNLNWVVDYDLQTQIAGGEWDNWLMATQQTTGSFPGYAESRYGDLVGFRVRGRDLIGNQSDYSAPAYTAIGDSVPPYAAHLAPLPPFQVAPIALSWSGADACADVVAYDLQYRVGASGDWQDWLTNTPATGGTFSPASPQYGEVYYFRVRAGDAAGNWSAWFDGEAQTTLAQFTLSGHVLNVRQQPIVAAAVDIQPQPLYLTAYRLGGFVAYLAAAGPYDISAARSDRYGTLPAMLDFPVDDHVSGLQFILPPHDDAVANGGFEAGSLDPWLPGSTALPALIPAAHTGSGAVQIGSDEGEASLSQVLAPGLELIDPTLSFLARLDQAGTANTIQVELSSPVAYSPPFTRSVTVDTDRWTHIWYELPALAGEQVTLTLTVSGSPSIVLDEVSLGSAVRGGYGVYLPLTFRTP